MIDDLRALAVFARTVELGSFRGAAKALALSPSVVSHHVALLESRVGVPLLYRSTRRLALTPEGERLFASAREMVEAAERGLDGVNGRSESPSGLLRVSVPAFLANTAFPRDLAAFSAEHPRVRLTVGFSDGRRELIQDGLDVALRIGGLEDSSLRARRLGGMRRVLVGAPSAMAGRPAPTAPSDLEAWEFVQLSSRPADVTLAARAGQGAAESTVTVRIRSRIAVDSAAAMRELVLAGAGIASLPEVIAREAIARGDLVPLLPGWTLSTLGVYAVWPANTQRPGLTLRFVDFVGERIARLFGEDGL